MTFTDAADNQETMTSDAMRAVCSKAGPLIGFTVVVTSGQTQTVLGTLTDGGTLTLDDPTALADASGA